MMQILTKQQLHRLTTARLLALYRRRRKLKNNLYADITDYGTAPEFLDEKDNPELTTYRKLVKYCKQMKGILDMRENVK